MQQTDGLRRRKKSFKTSRLNIRQTSWTGFYCKHDCTMPSYTQLSITMASTSIQFRLPVNKRTGRFIFRASKKHRTHTYMSSAENKQNEYVSLAHTNEQNERTVLIHEQSPYKRKDGDRRTDRDRRKDRQSYKHTYSYITNLDIRQLSNTGSLCHNYDICRMYILRWQSSSKQDRERFPCR